MNIKASGCVAMAMSWMMRPSGACFFEISINLFRAQCETFVFQAIRSESTELNSTLPSKQLLRVHVAHVADALHVKHRHDLCMPCPRDGPLQAWPSMTHTRFEMTLRMPPGGMARRTGMINRSKGTSTLGYVRVCHPSDGVPQLADSRPTPAAPKPQGLNRQPLF